MHTNPAPTARHALINDQVTTEKMIRRELEAYFKVDLTDKKPLIRKHVRLLMHRHALLAEHESRFTIAVQLAQVQRLCSDSTT